MIEIGFYKLDEGSLLFAPNAVYNKNYELHVENNSQYNYPVDGWYFFNSLIEAKQFFNITE